MNKRHYSKEKHMIAAEAANIIIVKGVSLEAAKREACKKLNISSKKKIPKDSEVEALLLERSELFDYKNLKNDIDLEKVRKTAIKAMQLFSKFNPKATGVVLTEIFHQNSSIELHLFADTIEEVERLLIDHHIPFELIEKKYKVSKEKWNLFYIISFFAGDDRIESLIFLNDGSYKNIIDVENEAPIKRVSLKQFLENQ